MVDWTDAARAAERWVFPAECLACQQPLAAHDDALVCGVCQTRWRGIPDPRCEICGEPLHYGLGCRLCLAWPAGFGPVRSAVRLDASARELVHKFKYDGWWRLAEPFARRMVPLLADVGDADLVPVPLAARRRQGRGYNQAEALATALSSLTGLPVRVDRLFRSRETPTQTRLTPEARLANLAEAFVAVPSDRPAWLVDDVFTTGATLTSASLALLDAGATQVGAVTFARAEPALTDAASRLAPFTLPTGDEEHE
ncbi:MAG: ComF family protein [Gemmatimonadota bacterium]